MPLRFLSAHIPGSFAVRLACLSLGVALSGCESPARQNNEPTLSPGPFIVSSPVVFPAVRAPSRLALSSLEEDLVYVSLPPGGIPGAISATIHDLRSGASVSVPVVNGGFDPVALPVMPPSPPPAFPPMPPPPRIWALEGRTQNAASATPAMNPVRVIVNSPARRGRNPCDL